MENAKATIAIAFPTPLRAWYGVAAFTLAYIISFIDRQVISLLVGPIKADLGLSDTQMSLLQGLSFALFYTLMGLPIGRVADQVNRRNLAIAGIALWSLMTAACGVVRSFSHLFLARMGVGFGEAALSPAAFAIIADSFPRHRMSFAISIYALGGFLGIGLALLVGGALIDLANWIGEVELFGRRLAGWQMIFLMLGALGFVGIAAMLGVKEPPRRGRGATEKPSIGATLRYLRKHAKIFVPMLTAFSLYILMSSAISAWGPSILIRVHGWTPSEAGYGLGMMTLLGSIVGILLTGAICDFAAARGVHDAPVIAGVVGAVGLFASLVPLAWVTSGTGVLACVGGAYFFMSPLGVAPAAVQMIAPGNMRSQLAAVYISSINLLGLSIGPTAVAVFTDYLFRDEMMVQASLALTAAIFMPVAIVLMALARRPFRELQMQGEVD